MELRKSSYHSRAKNIEFTIEQKDSFVFSLNFYLLEKKFIIRRNIVFHIVLNIGSNLENLSFLSYYRTKLENICQKV